jgi:radical SAM family uncharacterized protein
MTLLDQIRPLLRDVQSPAWYVGGEVNQIKKDPGAVVGHVALIYPDCYEVGMSHYGLKILYHILNEQPDLAAERAFTPWPDFAAKLEQHQLPLYSLETHTPLDAFDVLAFTIQSEMTLTNLLYTLELGRVPVRSAERGPEHPFVLAGGAGAYGPEILAGVVDLFALGDGEEIVAPLVRELSARRRQGEDRTRILIDLCKRFPFLYAPALYRERRASDGSYEGLEPLYEGLPEVIRSAYVHDLERAPFPTAPVVPHTQVVHDRIALEVMRGCVHGCRFCQAGMLTRPWRIRSPERLTELARANYASTGIEEISLLSLSTSDYPYLGETLQSLRGAFEGCDVNISLPSLRVNEELQMIPLVTKGNRRGGLTLAPEVATDRLRRKVNKPIRNEDLYRGAAEAFRNGWNKCKLYFMLGIPDELPSDLDGIVQMGERVSQIGREVRGGRATQVDVSVSIFVPKPFTPYQWDGMATREVVHERQQYLRKLKRLKSVRLKFHDPEQSFLEGVLARGDRRVGAAVLRAYELGARYDAWSEHFRADLWQQAFRETGVDPAFYACRTIPYAEALPWDHLDAGPSKEYLIEDSRKARAEQTVHHCFGNTCNTCGVDLKDCFDIKRAMPAMSTTATP